MSRTLSFLLAAITLAACASTRSERPVAEAPAPPPPGAQAQPAAPSSPASQGPAEEQAHLTRVQARLDEASRELQTARSEVSGSQADLQRARQQADAAARSDDALVRARAVEAVNAAQDRSRVANAHATYAQRLVDARTADVDVARAHLESIDVQRTPANDPTRDQRIADATQAERSARARALDLGQKALAAERQWHALEQGAQARAPGAAAAAPGSPGAMGTGSGATDAGARQPPPPPTRP